MAQSMIIDGFKYGCDQCNYRGRQHYDITLHKELIHKDVRYVCDLCNYKATNKVILEHISSQNMKVSSMDVTNVIIKQQTKVVLEDISSQNMKVSSMDVTYVTIKLIINLT